MQIDSKITWESGECLNAPELCRIERNVQILATKLQNYGYHVFVRVKTDWRAQDLPRQSDIDRIRANIDALQTGFARLPQWREVVYNDTLSAQQVNAWEWDMQLLSQCIWRMEQSFRHCDTFYTGEAWYS